MKVQGSNAILSKRQLLLLATVAAITPALAASKSQISILVFKDPSCGCCSGWVEKLGQAGFRTTISETADMASVKSRYKIPDDLSSCHTGIVHGLVVEGHVPPQTSGGFYH
ncbi:MAG: DUF411 domain-containing protein [Micropepsaceae bacterium]